MILYFVITAVLVCAAGWVFVNYTPVGQDDNHVLSIGIGGGAGPSSCCLTSEGLAGANPRHAHRHTCREGSGAGQAFLAYRTNFFFAVPMIFFMAASSHYTILGK